jgi:hypothetical protein
MCTKLVICTMTRQHQNVVAKVKTWTNRAGFNNDGIGISNLRFFRGNGIVVTWAHLDVRLICFARPSARNTLCKIWNSSTSSKHLHLSALKRHEYVFFKIINSLTSPFHEELLHTQIFLKAPKKLLPTFPLSLSTFL